MASGRPTPSHPFTPFESQRSESTTGFRRREWLALAAIVLAAAVLRVLRLGHGLPDVPDEDYPFRIALGMWGWNTGHTDWNPHFFIYPTLTIYLHFFVQKAAVAFGMLTGQYASPADYRLAFDIDPSPMVLTARAFDVFCDLIAVIGVARLAQRLRPGAGIPAALLAAVAPLLILTSRAVYCDTQLTALAVWSLERLVAWRERGGRIRLVAAVVLAGLAAGAKYPGGLLVLPIAWAILEREGWRGWWRAAAAGAGAFAVFLASSPYIVLDYPAFHRHFSQQTTHMTLGHLGHIGGTSFAPHLQTLVGNLGWAGVAFLALALLLALPGLASAAFGRGARVLWMFLLPLGLAFGLASTPMDRYLAPLVAVGAALAVATVMAAGDVVTAFAAYSGERLGRATEEALPRAAVALALVAMLTPVGWSGVRAALSGGGSTQAEARAWLAPRLQSRDMLVQEAYGAPLLTREQRGRVVDSPYFKAASAATQARYLAKPTYHVVNVPLFVEGRATVPVRSPSGAISIVPLFPFASDFCRVYYDPRLYAGVDYVITTGAVRGRFAADPARFAEQAAFYAFLDRDAELIAHFVSHDETIGPEVHVYRLGPRAQQALREAGELPQLWWADMMPESYRRNADRIATSVTTPDEVAPRTADGRLAPWVRSLSGIYQARISPFARSMASEMGLSGHVSEAEHFARANLAITPDDHEAFRLFVNCVFRRQATPRAARATVESTLKVLTFEDPRAASLRETYDWMLETLSRSGLEN